MWSILRSLGCDDAQGYFMSKPLSPELLAGWIRANEGRFSGASNSQAQSADSHAAEAAASVKASFLYRPSLSSPAASIRSCGAVTR